MQRVGGLFAELSLRTGRFGKGVRQAVRKTENMAVEMEQAISGRPDQALKQLGNTAHTTGTAISQAMSQGVDRIAESAKPASAAMSDLSEKFGVSRTLVNLLAGEIPTLTSAFESLSTHAQRTGSAFSTMWTSVAGMGEGADEDTLANISAVAERLETAFGGSGARAGEKTTKITSLHASLSQLATSYHEATAALKNFDLWNIVVTGTLREFWKGIVNTTNRLRVLWKAFGHMRDRLVPLYKGFTATNNRIAVFWRGLSSINKRMTSTHERVTALRTSFGSFRRYVVSITARLTAFHAAIRTAAVQMMILQTRAIATVGVLAQLYASFPLIGRFREFIQTVQQLSGELSRLSNQTSETVSRLQQLSQVNVSQPLGQARDNARELGHTIQEGVGEEGRRAMRDLGDQAEETGRTTREEAARTTRRTQEGMEASRKKARRVTWAVRGYIKDTARVITGILIARTFYMLLKRIEQLIGAAYELNLLFQEAAISFEYLLNATERQARHYAHSMRYWALDTQYSIRQMTDAFRDLYFTGVMNIQETESAMQILAGTATATGRPLNEIVSTMRRIATATALSTSELRALTRAGIDVGPMLQEHLGLTKEELLEINRMAIPGETAFRAIMLGLEDYAEAAVDGAQTVRARWSDFMETLADSIGLLAGPLFERWADTLENMLNWLVALREGLLGFGPRFIALLFPPGLREEFKTFLASMHAIWDAIKTVGQALVSVFRDALQFLISALSRVLPPVARLAQGIADLVRRASEATPAVRALVASIMSLLIAYSAASAVRVLVTWIYRLVFAGAIANAVKYLGMAFRFLAKNIWLVIAALAALFMFGDRLGAMLNRT